MDNVLTRSRVHEQLLELKMKHAEQSVDHLCDDARAVIASVCSDRGGGCKVTQLQHFPCRMEPRRLEGNRVTREDAVSVSGRTRCVMNTRSGVSSAVELR